MPRSPLVVLSVALLAACGGSTGDGPTPGPTAPGVTPPPPPAAAAPVITAWSPEIPYWGDTLTITGTGFGATPAANYVWFRNMLGVCGTVQLDTAAATIVSASSTQLRVRIPYSPPPSTDRHPQSCTRSRVRLSVGGSSTESPDITLRVPPWIRSWRAADGTSIARTEVSVTVNIVGLAATPEETELSVNGVVIPAAARTQARNQLENGDVTFIVPVEASPDGQGQGWQDTARVVVFARIRGRDTTASLLMRRYATMRIDSVQSRIVPQATPGARDSRELTVWVRNFYGPLRHIWRNSTMTQEYVGDIGIPDRYSGPITFSQPTGTPTGTYSVTLVSTRFPSENRSWSLDFRSVP